MLNYLKYLIFCSVVCLCFLLPQRASASHAAGGEITYEWVSGSTYRFYLKFYRDCGGISESSNVDLCYYNSCNTTRGSVRLTQMTTLPNGNFNGQEVNPGCPNFATSCRGGSLPGYQEWWYTGTVTLPSQCDSWTFYAGISARNTSTNITGATLYLEATLNNLDAQGNSSPYFSVKPVPYVCINNAYRFNNGALDNNNDSLAFEFITPRTGGTPCSATPSVTPVTYTSGFSLANPFATNNTFQFNTLTGELSFTPAAISANTVTVRVNEYRNGKKIGSVLRDLQIRVLSCNVPPPSNKVDSASLQGTLLNNGTVEGVANYPMSFCYTITSPSSRARLVVRDNHTISAPGSSTAYNGMNSDTVTGCLSWTPTCADTGLKIFLITVKDSTCDPPGIAVTQTFTIPIYIRAASATFRDVIICKGASTQIKTAAANVTPVWTVEPGGASINTLSCTGCPKPTATPDVTTTYAATYSLNGCPNTDYVTVHVGDSGSITITPASPYIVCRPGGEVTLEVNSTVAKPINNLACGVNATNPGSVTQTNVEIVPPNAALQNLNNPGSTPFGGNYNLPGRNNISARHQYLLRASDLRSSGLQSGTLTGMSFNISSIGQGAVYNNLTISLRCTNLTELDRNAGFVASTTRVYTAPGPIAILISGGYVNFTFDRPYDWDNSQNLIVDICYTNTDTASAAYTLYYNNNYQATLYSYTASGSICLGTPAPVYSTHELPQMRFTYYTAPEIDLVYQWGNAEFSPTDTSRQVSFFANESKQVYVSTVNRFGCRLSDTLDVYIPPPFVVSGDTSICRGQSAQLWARSVQQGNSVRSQWYENGYNEPATLSCNDCNEPIATPQQDATYTVITTDSVNCSDTFNIKVAVRPTPDVRILNNDTTILFGQQVQLNADGADTYVWFPISTLSSPNVRNPIAKPIESTTYVVTGMANGCISNDTVRINIDARDIVDIPTAFTPNGDGKNDVYRAVNLNGQKVVEFRVFNRWGREVFFASDNSGWDGTWNGVPQNMDTYYYLVHIVNLDGTVRVFKGDFTLIR